jgi:hypothetical protein
LRVCNFAAVCQRRRIRRCAAADQAFQPDFSGENVRLESLTYANVRLESLTYANVRLESLTYGIETPQEVSERDRERWA